jgi:nitroreductase
VHVEQAIASRRSIRRFAQDPVTPEELRAIAEAGRMAASAGNRQPCRFLVASRPEQVGRLHEHVAWLAGAGSPPPGKQPTAYLVILADPHVNRNYVSDCAAAAQNMLLAAHGRGLGACWIGSVGRDAVRDLMRIPADLEIYGVIALGWPGEEALARDSETDMVVTRDPAGTVRVPKRRLDDVLRFEHWED